MTQLAELLRTRQISSLELTEMYLARLKRFDPVLECVAAYTEDLAYTQAKRADDEIARGLYRSPLHGLPWGAKDLLATRGYPTGWGAMPYKDQVIDLDATVVQRLEAAGAVLIAKLTLGALANGDVWHGGTTKNPWDTGEGSSGSSRDRARRPPPVWSASPSAPRPWVQSSRPPPATAFPACVLLSVASAAMAQWRSVGAWTRSVPCAAASRIARSSSAPSTVRTGAI